MVNPYKLLHVKGGSRKKLPLLFECLLCKNKFNTEDVEKKRFYVGTCICRACYTQAQKTPAKIWCFGKLQKGNSPGYNEENVGCRLLCPDRKVCKVFIRKLNKEK